MRLVLEPRGRHWFVGAEAPRQGLLRFAQPAPPTQLLTVVCRAWFYACCTSARFRHPGSFPRMARMGDRLGLADDTAQAQAHASFVAAIGPAPFVALKVALKVSVVLDALICG